MSPALMMEGVVVRDRRKRGVDAEARMSGRERDCMVQLKLKLEVEVERRGRCSGESRGEKGRRLVDRDEGKCSTSDRC